MDKRMKRFVTQGADLTDWQPSTVYPLPEDVAHHVLHVMRMGPGDTLELMDRAQNLVSARLTAEGCLICLDHTTCPPHATRFQIHHGVALIKWPHFEWMLEKVAEIGISELTPLCCERSVIRVRDWETKAERLQKIITQAARQSLNPTPPILHAPMDVRTFVSSCDARSVYFAHPGTYPRLGEIAPSLEGDVRFVIGPEGGFSPQELAYLLSHATPVSLGTNVLRTETAAVACAMTRMLF